MRSEVMIPKKYGIPIIAFCAGLPILSLIAIGISALFAPLTNG